MKRLLMQLTELQRMKRVTERLIMQQTEQQQMMQLTIMQKRKRLPAMLTKREVMTPQPMMRKQTHKSKTAEMISAGNVLTKVLSKQPYARGVFGLLDLAGFNWIL